VFKVGQKVWWQMILGRASLGVCGGIMDVFVERWTPEDAQ